MMKFKALILFLFLSCTSYAQTFIRDKKVRYETAIEVTSSVPLTPSTLNTVAVESFHGIVGNLSACSGVAGIGVGYMSYSGMLGADRIVSDLDVSINDINFRRKGPYLKFALMVKADNIRKIRKRVSPFASVNMYYLFMKDRVEPYTFDVTLPDNPDMQHPIPSWLAMKNAFWGIDFGVEFKSTSRVRFYISLSMNVLSIGGQEVEALYAPMDQEGKEYSIIHSIEKTDPSLNIKLGVRL